jgi:nucleoside transporter
MPATIQASPILTERRSSSFPLLTRLSLMMFLQYFVQGAYLPIASVYAKNALGFTAWQVGVFGAALAVGPILAPFVFGQLVDRLFATERVMAVCHLVGGLLMVALYFQTAVWPVIILGTIYSVLYVPTMMLTNSLAFEHLRNSDMEFPWVRLFGTAGYIVPAYLIEVWWLSGLRGQDLEVARGIAFALSGAVSLLMALYCLTLPHTPPKQNEQRKYAPGAVIAMLVQRDFLVLVIVSFFISMVHNAVVTWYSPFMRNILDTGDWGAWEQRISSLGQICELGVLAVLGLFIKRLGFKWTLILGASAYLARCLLFAVVFSSLNPPFLGKVILGAAGQALHGFCFGCFLAAAYIYVDRIATLDIRGSMQNLYGVFVVALGFFAGSLASGQVVEWYTTIVGGKEIYDWTSIWLIFAVPCAACVVALMALFSNKTPEPAERLAKQG